MAPAGPSIFLFGNRGYMSVVLPALVARRSHILGLCTRPPPPALKSVRARVRRLLNRLGLSTRGALDLAGPFDSLPPPASLAREKGIPVFFSTNLRDAAFLAAVREMKPDIILVAGFHKLIPPELFGTVRIAAVNVHPSLLPRNRGGTPNRWIVRRGERETGLSAHALTAAFDTGAVLLQESVPVTPADSWGDVELRLLGKLPAFAATLVDGLAQGTLLAIPQDETRATTDRSYSAARDPVQWTWTADEIRRCCNAMRPKSGALSAVNGRRLALWDVAPCGIDATAGGDAGEVIAIDSAGTPRVRCSDGAVDIMGAVFRGQIMSGRRLVRALSLKLGDRFARIESRNA